MPHYFLPDVNLLDGMNENVIDNTRRHLKNLKSKKGRMMKLLRVEQ